MGRFASSFFFGCLFCLGQCGLGRPGGGVSHGSCGWLALRCCVGLVGCGVVWCREPVRVRACVRVRGACLVRVAGMGWHAVGVWGCAPVWSGFLCGRALVGCGCAGGVGGLVVNCIVDASILLFSVTECFLFCSCVLLFVVLSVRWMPWHQGPMKDVVACDKPRGAG